MFRQIAPTSSTISAIVRIAEDRLAALSDQRHRASRSGKPFTATLVGPLPVYQLQLGKLNRSSTIAAISRHTNNRYLVLDTDKAVAALDLPENSKEGRSKRRPFARVAGNRAALQLLKAIERIYAIGQREKWRKGAHELRLLRVPSLHMHALWVTGRQDDILLMRLDGREIAPRAMRLVSEKKLIELLLPMKVGKSPRKKA